MKKILLFLSFALPLYAFSALLNMIVLEKASMPGYSSLSAQLQEDWNLELDSASFSTSENTMTFQLEGETLAVMLMEVAIPWGEIEGACRYSFTWKEASAEMRKHGSHLIISVLSQKSSLLDREVILNMVVSSMLKLTESIGVYIGRAELVRSRREFILEAMRIKQNALPVANWLFFGLTKTKKGNAGFTLGLKDFGFMEFEILASEKPLGDMYILFYNTAHYVVNKGVVFRDKETFGYTKTQKLPIRIKKSAITRDKKVVRIGY